jgi:hypothetical protein
MAKTASIFSWDRYGEVKKTDHGSLLRTKLRSKFISLKKILFTPPELTVIGGDQ